MYARESDTYVQSGCTREDVVAGRRDSESLHIAALAGEEAVVAIGEIGLDGTHAAHDRIDAEEV